MLDRWAMSSSIGAIFWQSLRCSSHNLPDHSAIGVIQRQTFGSGSSQRSPTARDGRERRCITIIPECSSGAVFRPHCNGCSASGRIGSQREPADRHIRRSQRQQSRCRSLAVQAVDRGLQCLGRCYRDVRSPRWSGVLHATKTHWVDRLRRWPCGPSRQSPSTYPASFRPRIKWPIRSQRPGAAFDSHGVQLRYRWPAHMSLARQWTGLSLTFILRILLVNDSKNLPAQCNSRKSCVSI